MGCALYGLCRSALQLDRGRILFEHDRIGDARVLTCRSAIYLLLIALLTAGCSGKADRAEATRSDVEVETTQPGLSLSALGENPNPFPRPHPEEAVEADGRFYDAWVEFVDKETLTEERLQEIVAALGRSFEPRALERRRRRRTFSGLFDERDFPILPES